MFRSYRAFASQFYKFAIWFAYPVLAIFCCILVQSGGFGFLRKTGYSFMLTAILLCYGIIFMEGMGDYWIFSGIQSKNSNRMDLIKSSKRGKLFFRNALISDVLRRVATVIICNSINVLIGVGIFEFKLGGSQGILIIMTYTLCCYLFSTLTIFISRFGDGWWLNLGIAYASGTLATLVIFLITQAGLPIWVWLVIFFIASIIITIITVKTAIRKLEDSYYDQRS